MVTLPFVQKRIRLASLTLFRFPLHELHMRGVQKNVKRRGMAHHWR